MNARPSSSKADDAYTLCRRDYYTTDTLAFPPANPPSGTDPALLVARGCRQRWGSCPQTKGQLVGYPESWSWPALSPS